MHTNPSSWHPVLLRILEPSPETPGHSCYLSPLPPHRWLVKKFYSKISKTYSPFPCFPLAPDTILASSSGDPIHTTLVVALPCPASLVPPPWSKSQGSYRTPSSSPKAIAPLWLPFLLRSLLLCPGLLRPGKSLSGYCCKYIPHPSQDLCLEGFPLKTAAWQVSHFLQGFVQKPPLQSDPPFTVPTAPVNTGCIILYTDWVWCLSLLTGQGMVSCLVHCCG